MQRSWFRLFFSIVGDFPRQVKGVVLEKCGWRTLNPNWGSTSHLAHCPRFSPPRVSGQRSRIAALCFGHICRASLPTNLAAAPAHFSHNEGNVGLGGRKKYWLGILCGHLGGDERRPWRFGRIGHLLNRPVDKLIYVGFSVLAYSLRHGSSMAHAKGRFKPGKIQSSPLPSFAARGGRGAVGADRRETEQTFFVHQFLPISPQ